MKLYYYLKSLWTKQRYTKFGVCCALLLCGFIFLCLLLTTAFIALQGFMARHIEPIMLSAFALAVIFYYLKERTEERQKAQVEMARQAQESTAFAEQALAENGYEIVRECLYKVLSDISDTIGLVRPDHLSQLDSPARYVKKGNVLFYQLVANKKEVVIDPNAVKQVLQMRISQRLNAQEFSGITQATYIYKGKPYPILYVDEVVDVGNYIQIDITWVGDTYCEYLRSKTILAREGTQPPTNPRDSDF